MFVGLVFKIYYQLHHVMMIKTLTRNRVEKMGMYVDKENKAIFLHGFPSLSMMKDY